MADRRHLELFLLQYVPSPIANASVNIGLVLLERSESARSVIDARFTSNWQLVLALDPDADIELLDAAARDICERLKNGDSAGMLRRIEDSFSNAIQVSSCAAYSSERPGEDIETLVATYLH